MKHVSANYIPPDKAGEPAGYARFLKSTWLVENALHQARVGGDETTKLCVVLVGNTASIPDEVMGFLRDHYDVSCQTPLYEEICRSFPNLCRRLNGPYSVFAFGFLRWVLVDRLFGGEPVACYDGDIIHNAPLDALSRAFEGLTRTATSTAFAAISDRAWFSAWTENLKLFDRSPRAFVAPHLHRLRAGHRQFAASPEEYFAKLLIETGELRNDELPEDFGYWIAPQPQHLPRLNNFFETRTHRRIPTPMDYSRVGGVDLIDGKPLAFWHMQKPFMSQLSCLAMFRETAAEPDPGRIHPFNYYGRVPDERDVEASDSLDPGDFLSVPAELRGLAQRVIEMESQSTAAGTPPAQDPFHPAFLYDYYFRRFDFSLLFNDRRWPVAGQWRDDV